jgi:hypothetical protein
MRKINIHPDSTVPLDTHFHGSREAMRPLFNELIEQLKDADFQFKIGKSYIGLIRSLVFTALHIQAKKIVVEVVARKKFKSPRIVKILHFQKARWAHYVPICHIQDIDEEIIHWIIEASLSAPLRAIVKK